MSTAPGLPAQKCGEKFFATLLPSFIRPLSSGEEAYTSFAAEGVCSEEREASDTESSHIEKAGCSERKISPRRARRAQREIRLKKNFVIFVYFVVDKYYHMSL